MIVLTMAVKELSSSIELMSRSLLIVLVVVLALTNIPGIQAQLPTEDGGDAFSNNLFSDLAPLIALFGEQVSKQFISNSIGFTDNIIFAMAPLGIITAVVSAIRVGGPRWLRALIGRARESPSAVELELMSSTSHEVCELWKEEGLVRANGTPHIAQLLFERCTRSLKVYTLDEARQTGLVAAPGEPGDGESGERLSFAPNLVLNLVPQPSASERRLIATFGVALQCFVLVFSALATYRWSWLKGGSRVTGYAYPLAAVGTIAICCGMIICTHVVEASTSKSRLDVKKAGIQVVWLQRNQTVNDQVFSARAFIINDDTSSNRQKTQCIRTSQRTSQRNGTVFHIKTLIGTVVSLVGFVLQFVGLRGLHWSATIAQLGAMFLMTILRSYIRRGLSNNTLGEQVLDGHELDWLSMDLYKCATWQVIGIK
jgi:hypothetical protein